MTGLPSNVVAFPLHRARRVDEPFVRKSDVARYLGVSERWIELRMRDAGFPFHKDEPPRRLVWFRMSEVAEWMSRRAAS